LIREAKCTTKNLADELEVIGDVIINKKKRILMVVYTQDLKKMLKTIKNGS